MVRITAPVTPAWDKANARAVANAAAGRRAERTGERTYTVASAHGAEVYTVTVESVINLQATCSCKHGQHADAKGICWHKSAAIAAAVVHIAEVERTMARFGRP